MLNRRKVLFGAAALMAAALPAMPVMASDSRLLADILAGVSDALTRDYIRRHLSGRPLGRQPLELRRPAKPPQHPQHPQQKPGPQAGRNPPKGPGHDNGRHEGRKNDGRRDNWDGPR